MKGISKRQAQRCEEACTKRCRCRCGGQLHGKRRGDVDALPANDPHAPGTSNDWRWVQLQLDLAPTAEELAAP